MAKHVVLEDSVIAAMLRNNKIVNEFPFLKGASAKLKNGAAGKCGKCGRGRRADKNAVDYGGLRTAIGTMSLQKQGQLKALLGASNVTVRYIDPKRRRIKKTF